MADLVSYGNPERDIEQALIVLKRGTQLIKYSRKGKPKFCPFRISPDETTLIWYSNGHERNLKLSSVSRIIPGQRTAVFRRFLRPEKEYLSFSLLYNNGERTLDLICKDKIEAAVWLAGLKALTSTALNRRNRTRSDISDLNAGAGGFVGAPLELTSGIARDRVSVDSFSCEAYFHLQASDVGSEHANMHVRTSIGDGFRISVSSTPSTSSQGSGPDDIESLGDVYVWGEVWCDTTDESMTVHPTKTDVLIPKPLESNVVLDVHQIACGFRHLALVTKQGEVFTWGEESGGRLGHGIEKDFSRPHLVEFLAVTSMELVACGEYHSCALSISGDLYTWGDGAHHVGLLGHGTNVSHWIPKRVSGLLEGLQVLSVACGTWHSAVVTSEGRLFTFGDGTFGALGHGDRENVPYPREVQSLSGLRTMKVACGVWHTAAIIEVMSQSGVDVSSRKLFTWGDGDKNRLGHGNKKTYLHPTCVSTLIEYNFHQIACGHCITVALTTSGHVFTMGSPAHGQLGNPESDGRLPCLVQDRLVGEFVEEISCGAYHVAVLTSRSEVFTWGKGANGRLGHGDSEDRKTPTLVEALKDRHVKNISCGSNYSASICIHKWVSGVDQSVCFGCRQAFGFTRKRHNCYNCGLVHCHACSSKKALRAALAPTPGKPHRVCDSCYAKLKSAGNTTSKRITAAHHPLDVREMCNTRESKTSRLLLPPPAEPLKDIHITLAQPGPKPDPHAFVRVPQPPHSPSLLQFADIAFPSSLTALQYAFNYKPAMGTTSQPQPLPQPHTQIASNSRPSSPYSRRPSPPRSVSPAFSRGVIDSLKKTNDLLSQEVSRMQIQIKILKQKTERQDAEIQKLNGTAEEATFLAAQASSKSTVAKEVIKSVMAELEEMKEKLPAEMLNSEEFKTMYAQVEDFFSTGGAPVVEYQSSSPADTVFDRQNQPQKSTFVENTTNKKYRRMSANLDGADMRSLFQNGEDTQKDGNTSAEIIEAGTLESSKSGLVLPTAPKHEAKREVIEQFEPGVYVTLVIQNGMKTFKRVRFSKRRFAEQQAEEWWKENKDRLLKKYAVPIANSSSTESALTHGVPAEENNGVTTS